MYSILHIGAGQAAELDQWLACGAQSIVLVEPNPVLAEQLRQKTAHQPQVKIVEVAVTPELSNNQLNEYNVPGVNSLRAATGLKTIFPGLQVINTHTVKTLSPEQLLEKYMALSGQEATLIITAAGEEQAILQALIASDQLKAFNQIEVTTGVEPLFESSVSKHELLSSLQNYGYELTDEIQSDPDWVKLQLQRNPLKDQIAQLQAELIEKEKALEEAVANEKSTLAQFQQAAQHDQAALQKARDEIASLKAREEMTVNALEQSLAKAREEIESLKANEQKTIKALEQALAAKEDELSQSKNASQTHKTHAQGIQQKLDEQEQRAAQYTEQVKELEQTLTAEKAIHAKVKQAAEQDQAALAKVREEIESLKANEQKTIKALEQSLATKEKELEQSQKELKQTQGSLQEHKTWFKSRKEQAEKLEVALAQEKEKNQKLIEQKDQIVADQSQNKDLMSTLEARMEQLFTQQASQIQQATNALGKHVTQSFVHQRQHYQSVTGLHQYLENGEQPLAFGSWAIDTELAVHLVRAIEQNNYDLIIEFGSGTSTALMARAVFNTLVEGKEVNNSESLSLEYEDNQASALSKQKKGARAVKSKALSLNEYDLPRRILSFEQDKAYQQQTKATLTAQGLANLVELVLAPLVPTRLSHQSEQNVLFYDCEKHLARIASLYENKQARILVLVDGPASPKNNLLIREPALANVLQYLSAHHLDIVLDDSSREGEQQVAELWREVCEERGLSWQEEELGTEKGALWLTVRP